jgi:hypothetical protein
MSDLAAVLASIDFKDYVGLLSLLISVATFGILGFWVPNRRRKIDLAIDLYKQYHSDGMQTARGVAWLFLHRCETDDKELRRRVALIWKWTVFEAPPDIDKDELVQVMAVRRVLDFFSACEQCVCNKTVDTRLLVALLGHTFSRWSELNIERFIRHPNYTPSELAVWKLESGRQQWPLHSRALWLDGLPELRKLCVATEAPPRSLGAIIIDTRARESQQESS